MRARSVDLCLAFAFAFAFALPCAAAEPLDALSLARLQWLESRLDAGRDASLAWWTSWTVLFGAACAGQAITAATIDSSLERSAHLAIGLRVSAAKTAIGLVAMLAQPLPFRFGSNDLRRDAPTTPDELQARLVEAEMRLRAAARSERRGRHILMHAGGLLVNGAGSAWLWAHDDLPRLALASFVLGVIVGEARIFTQPSDAIWQEEALDLAGPTGVPRDPALTLTVTAIPSGLALVGRF